MICSPRRVLAARADPLGPIDFVRGALLVALASGCGSDQALELGTIKPSPVPHFTVRGRQAQGAVLGIRIDERNSPLEAGVFRDSILQAMATWNATGIVQLHEVAEEVSPAVVCAWRRTTHDACPSFGKDTTVAHAGPVSADSFIHFDASREWSSSGSGALPLAQVALHELGHLLGLGHSLDQASVMHVNYDARRDSIAMSDLAGLAALYGELAAAPGDLWIGTESGANTPLLQRIAPRASTGFALWDVTGNGRDDLLLWRTDLDGAGRLMVYHFDEARRLIGSSGPMLACLIPGARIVFGQNPAGQGVLLSIREDGSYSARRFLLGVFPRPIPTGEPFELQTGFADADGDGTLDSYPPGWGTLTAPQTLHGDLDGDGLREQITRE